MPQAMGNLTENMLVPPQLRRRYLQTLDEYDKRWEPLFSGMMPRRQAPGRGSKHYWQKPRTADPQAMAKFYEELERVEPTAWPHARFWSYNTRTLATAYRRGKRMFMGDFEGGILERAHALMLERITKDINRAIEFTLCRFAYGDSEVMEEFTTQDLNRQAVVKLDDGSFNGDVVTGDLGAKAWDDFSGGAGNEPDVFKDLAFMIERFEYINGNSPTQLIIGRKTALALEINPKLLERLIQFSDTTNGVLGVSIQGLKIVKITGQTYKEVPGVDAEQEGYPGKGDYLEMDWNNLNRIDMMTELIGEDRWEWGVLTDGSAGEVACGWVDEDHKSRGSPVSIFLEQFEEPNPKQVWTIGKLEICPVVNDYAKIMLIRALAQQ